MLSLLIQFVFIPFFLFIFSKVNCGGRAHKSGLKVNDEILAVNNFEVDKHPRTLARHTEEDDDKDKIEGKLNSF